jgi:glycosyltransferase involved in cell wall biosynthesis
MKIIHLLSNWKWTERSEPVVDLAIAQQTQGADVSLICGQAPAHCPVTDVASNALQKGLLEVQIFPEMSKHFDIFSFFQGRQKIRKVIETECPDVIHCHMQNAHLLAGLALRKNTTPLTIRTIYTPEQIRRDMRHTWCIRHCTQGIIVVSEKVKHLYCRQGVSLDAIEVIAPGIDVQRFSPVRPLEQDIDFVKRDDFFVAGMITRIRETRRLDIPLQALHQLQNLTPQLRLLLVGRGRPGAFEKVVDQPATAMGIRDQIIPVGYCQGDALVAALRKMDVLLYPMPGTDKTCRTVREALAAGVPVIAPRYGFLPELIQDGVSGRLVDGHPASFAQALKDLMDSPEYLQRLSQGALESARKRFDLSVQAEKTLQLYTRLSQKKNRSPKRDKKT